MGAKELTVGGEFGLERCRRVDLNPCGGMDHKLTYLEATVRSAGTENK